jgi:TonB family protein
MRPVLVLAFFLLGIAIMLLAGERDSSCGAAGWLERGAGPDRCPQEPAAVETEAAPATEAPEPRETSRRSAPAAARVDSLAWLPGNGSPAAPVAGVTGSAAADRHPSLALLGPVSPVSRAVGAPLDPSDDSVDSEPEKPGRAGGMAMEMSPIRMTSVPVPADPDLARRLLEERYPQELKASGTGGRVVLSLTIDRRGRVRDAAVVSSSGHDALDAAALEVAGALRFTPAQQQGRSTETRILYPVAFQP